MTNTPTKRDFLNGDHSFKMWFKIMWKNGYIFLFLVGLTMLVFELANLPQVLVWNMDAWEEGIFPGILVTIGNFIPISMVGLIAYKAFYQYWQDLKNGISR